MNNISLQPTDLKKVVDNLPDYVKGILRTNNIFLAGGSIVSILKDVPVNDYDFFGPDFSTLENAAKATHPLSLLKGDSRYIYSDNAITVKYNKALDCQFITKWTFKTAQEVCNSFDFAICRAVIYWDRSDGEFKSVIDKDFYYDLHNNQLTYKSPVREEISCGSLLRAFKYANKGYKVGKDTVAKIVARFNNDPEVCNAEYLTYDESAKASHLSRTITKQTAFRGNY